MASQQDVHLDSPHRHGFCSKLTDFLFLDKRSRYDFKDADANVGRWNRKFVIFLFLTTYALVSLVLEVMYMMISEEYKQTAYGRQYPGFSVFGFAAGPVAALTALIGLSFLTFKSAAVASCAESMDKLFGVFDEFLPADYRGLIRKKMSKWIVVHLTLGIVRLVLGLLKLKVMRQSFLDPMPYGYLPGFVCTTIAYREMVFLFSMMMFFLSTLIFTFFASCLSLCMDAFVTENDSLLQFVRSIHYKTTKVTDDDEKVIERLKTLRRHHEAINEMYDQIQGAFGLKTLLDVGGSTLSLMLNIAWFAMWSVQEDLLNWQSIGWNAVSMLTYLATVTSFIETPFIFQGKFTRMVEGIEKILFLREESNSEDVAKSEEACAVRERPTLEEIGLGFALRRRLESKVLSFAAGGVMDIRHMVVSLSVAIGTFLVFVTQRISFYNDMQSKSGAVCLSGVIVNGTCSLLF